METKYLLKHKGKELYFNSLEQLNNFLSLREIAEKREENKNKVKTL
jgi:YHS domain-containing protein